MNCPNCNSHVELGSSFCGVCGAKIETSSLVQNGNLVYNQQNNTQIQYNNVPSDNYQSHMQYNNGIQSNYQSQMYYQQNVNREVDNEEKLMDAYIGKNADKLKNGGFSLNVFFFGNIYVLYRKMWLLGILWFVGSMIVSMFLSSFSSLISTFVGIYISTQFKNMYLNHVKEQVKKIQTENVGKTYEELKLICEKKGGTTIWPVIIFILFYVVLIGLFFLLSFASIYDTMEKSKENYDEYISDGSDSDGGFKELEVTIPSQFESSEYNSEYYNSFSLLTDTDYCRLSLTTTSTVLYESAREYLEEGVFYSAGGEISSFEEKTINGNIWTTFSVQSTYDTTYYYAIVHNDEIYNVEFEIYNNDTNACSEGHLAIVNSLKFD